MKTNLKDNQIKAIEKLKKLKVGALFMEPGTGKTRVTVNLINSSTADFAFFVCPFQTKKNLLTEIKKWGLKIPYEIVGVETLSSSDNTYMAVRQLLGTKSHVFMVVDESLKIKNGLAIRTKRVIELAKFSEFRLILNGTPISKNVLDLWSQLEFLSPKILNMDYYEYLNSFVEYIQHCDSNQIEILSYRNFDYLYSVIEPFVFEAKLSLNIESENNIIDYWLTYESLTKYNQIKHHYIYEADIDTFNIFMAMIQELQQSYCDDDNKLCEAEMLAKRIGIDDTLIFCKFIKSANALTSKNSKLNVITYGKGSYGLNLQKYKHIIFFDKTFDYAQLEQAKRRIYRTGQKNNVSYYYLTGDVGLEKVIDRNIDYKESMLEYFKKNALNGKGTGFLNAI